MFNTVNRAKHCASPSLLQVTKVMKGALTIKSKTDAKELLKARNLTQDHAP